MSLLWVFLAAQLSLPVPLGLPLPDVRAIFSADDMPAYVQEAGISRFVVTRTTVRPDGIPQECSVERGSGDAKLDAYTCAIILKRAKFEPAKWVDGMPAFGVLRVPVAWAIGSDLSRIEIRRANPPDIELTVNRLPGGAGAEVSFSLMIAVDEAGRVVSCAQALAASKNLHAKTYPELLPIACEQATTKFTAVPARDGSGKAVRSVQTASVAFSAAR